jgi:hypothetical protein
MATTTRGNTIITIRGRDGNAVVYEMNGAQPFVLHAIRLLTDRWGTILNDPATVPDFVIKKAALLAVKHGQPYSF